MPSLVGSEMCIRDSHVCADGYLYNMVRIFVGTLVEAGAGRMPPERVRDILEEKKRSLAGDTAPAQGLFLYKVNYSEEEAGNTQAAQEITAKQE